MADVIDLTERRAAKTLPPKVLHTPVTMAAWTWYEDCATNFVHVYNDYIFYMARDETTEQERINLADALHEANDRLFDAAKAYDESFRTQAKK